MQVVGSGRDHNSMRYIFVDILEQGGMDHNGCSLKELVNTVRDSPASRSYIIQVKDSILKEDEKIVITQM